LAKSGLLQTRCKSSKIGDWITGRTGGKEGKRDGSEPDRANEDALDTTEKQWNSEPETSPNTSG
jgi:hypothetical protein